MHGRSFATMQVEAYIATGNERFSKSGDKKAGVASIEDDEDTNKQAAVDEEEGERLDKFGSWLEEEKEVEVGAK